MKEEHIVRYYFESQRPMTKEEEYKYWQLQMKQYRSKFAPMTPVIDMGEVLKTMIAKEKLGK